LLRFDRQFEGLPEDGFAILDSASAMDWIV